MTKSKLYTMVALIAAIIASTVFPTTVFAQNVAFVWGFVSETVPDNTCFAPNTTFEKSWTVKNVGTTDWSQLFHLDFISGTAMTSTTSMLFGYNVGVGSAITLKVTMTTPATPGKYMGTWSTKTKDNVAFYSTKGNDLSIVIDVSPNCTTAGSSVNGNSLPVQQNGVISTTSTPQPSQFDFYTQGNTAYTYINGQWVVSTVSPNGKYIFPQVSGTVTMYEYEACTNQWVWNGWNSGYQKTCTTKQRGFQEIGLMPVTSVDPAGVVRFYRFIHMLSFGMVGMIGNGTLTAQGGYTITYLGEGGSVSASTVAATLARFAVPALVVGYITYSSGIFIVTYPIHPVVVATAPAYAVDTLPGIIFGTAAVVAFESLDPNNCYLKGSLNENYIPDSHMDKGFSEYVKHSGKCTNADVKYILSSILKQLNDYLDQVRKVLQDPKAMGATQEQLAILQDALKWLPQWIRDVQAFIGLIP